MLKDYISFGIGNILHRKLRSWLTMIGIFIGIAAVVALISLGQGLQNAINEQFEMIGADKLFIQIKGGFGGVPGDFTPSILTSDDEDEVRRVKGVEEVAVLLFSTAKLEWKDKPAYVFVYSAPLDRTQYVWDEMFAGVGIMQGRPLKDGDRFKVVVGYDLTTEKVHSPLMIGSKVAVNGKVFDVVGIYEKTGDPSNDNGIFMAEDTYREIFSQPEKVDYLVAKTSKGEDPLAVAAAVEKELRKFRGLEEGKEDFTVQTPDDILETFNAVLNIVVGVLVGIAAISLVVGGIGIMNTMYTAVLERTKEIGIMKSIGARNRDIFVIFLVESGLLGLTGGAIGVLLGMGFSKLVELITATLYGPNYLSIQFPAYLIFGALLFSFLVGAASGVTPAWQASRMKPVDALRYE